ncbi:hypothetical protein HGRIS_002321 [Hohenbuehelia grisea]|uniref:FAD-binding PCMH-type domain-containing protein n=1 Tax=Hohenbuehelia grisea TaxID=104357 RepID=A0ABR3JL16_9AGAR
MLICPDMRNILQPLTCLAAACDVVSADVTEFASHFARSSAILRGLDKWEVLNHTVQGRLFRGAPFAAPCFSTVDGQARVVNDSACATIQANYNVASFNTEHFGAYTLPQWEGCQKTSQQCILDVSNTRNPAAFANQNCAQGSVSPYYIDVRQPSDIQAAFAFSQSTGVDLSIKNSGHDFKGRSSAPNSLSLWTFNLKSVSYSANFIPEGGHHGSRAITAGAGANWNEVYEFADAHNVTAVGGYHETVGAVGGWLLGGGHSVLSVVHGLGVDRVIQFKVVTPDGKFRTANDFQNSDLFWALRGGGGSTFGVVTEATFVVEPVMPLQVASLRFPATASNTAPFLKMAVDDGLEWAQKGWGGHIGANSLINVNPLITLEQAKADLANISQYVLAQNGTVVVETLPTWLAFFKKYVLPAPSVFGVELLLSTRLIPTDVFTSESKRQALHNILLDALPLPSPMNPYIIATPPLIFNHTEGATSVSPAWRKAVWHVNIITTFKFNSTLAEKQAQYKNIADITQKFHDLAPDSGVYLNEGAIHEPNFQDAFWGPNYPRLLQIKHKYDPHGLLDCWQCGECLELYDQ